MRCLASSYLLILIVGIYAEKHEEDGANDFAEFDTADESPPSSTIESILEEASKHVDKKPAKAAETARDSSASSTKHESNFDMFEFEEDEFENIEASKKPDSDNLDTGNQDAEKLVIKPLTFTDIPSHLRSNWSSYQVEALALVIICLYILSYIYGKTRNQTIASNWLAKNRVHLEQQFALVGDDGISQEPEGGHLIRETDANFSIWCTGRTGCLGMLSQLRLQKRQDFVSTLVGLYMPRRDRVIHRIELERGEMDSFVFILGQRKSVVGAVKELNDLQTFTKERRAGERFGDLPANFIIFSEIAETIPALIDTSVLSFIKQHQNYIDYIHFSDQYSGPRPTDDGSAQTQLPSVKPILHFSFYVMPDEYSDDSAESNVHFSLMQFMFVMVDRVRSYRLSREAKNKAERTRKSVEEAFLKVTHQQRQEAAQARREEKARERKQRVMEEEDPEKQRRLEKLEQKRDAKTRQPRMKQVRIK